MDLKEVISVQVKIASIIIAKGLNCYYNETLNLHSTSIEKFKTVFAFKVLLQSS